MATGIEQTKHAAEWLLTMLTPQGVAALAGAVIGGSLAFLGSIVGQVMVYRSARLQRDIEHSTKQRERLERITELMGLALSWYPKISSCRTLEELSLTPAPVESRMVVMLANLYFPALVSPAVQWGSSFRSFFNQAVDCFQPALGTTVGDQMSLTPTDENLRQQAIDLRLALEDAITAEAQKYQGG